MPFDDVVFAALMSMLRCHYYAMQAIMPYMPYDIAAIDYAMPLRYDYATPL